MSILSHPFILPSKQVYTEGKYLHVVSELKETTMSALIEERGKNHDHWLESELLEGFAMVLMALEHTHYHGFFHGNVNCSHVFVKGNVW